MTINSTRPILLIDNHSGCAAICCIYVVHPSEEERSSSHVTIISKYPGYFMMGYDFHRVMCRAFD